MINGGIINTVAAAAEVCTTNDSSFPASNLAYYKLDGDAIDSAGTNNGTASNVTWGVGKFGPAAVFNGTSSKIVTGVNLTLQSACSLSVWIYFTGANFFPIFGGNNTTSGSTTINRHFAALNAGASRFDYISKAGAFFRSTNISLFNSNAWNHIVITDDFTNNSTSSKLYVNGTQETNFVRIITSYGGAINTNLYIGQSRTNGNAQQYLTGTLDQVRIFNTVITQAQVTELYEDEIECCTTDEVNYPVANTAYYQLNGGTGTTVTDETGTYNGTAVNGITYGAGKFDDAAVFNGINDYINLGNGLTSGLTNSFTVSLWLKINTSPSGNTCAFSFQRTIWFDMFVPASNILNVRLLNSSVTSSAVSILNPLVNGTWNNVVFVADKTNSIVKLYLNGQLQGSASWNGTKYDRVQKNVIGSYGTGTTAFFPGSVDQVRIFPTAITAGQVAELYQERQCGLVVPSEHFNVVLYEGNETSQNITTVGFDPDMIWLKNRDISSSHLIFDVQRSNNYLIPNLALAEDSSSSNNVNLITGGFSLSGGGTGSNNGPAGQNDYVAWCWKAGGAAAPNTNGTITSQVSANTDAGFSIVKYTGGNSSSDTVGHGLTDVEMIILKDLTDGTNNWRVWHKDLNANYWMYLNLTLGQANAAADGGIRNVNSNSFGFINGTTGGVEGVNSSASDYIAYCFHSVDGFSKFDSYPGTGVNGNSIVTGFRPAFVMVKRINASDNWQIADTKRSNVSLFADLSSQELGNNGAVSFESNGFTVNGASGGWNNGTSTYIYMAFAD